MPTYVLMTKLDPTALRDRQRAGDEWKKRVEKLAKGIKWRAHYALLGPYDFMDVYDAKSDEAAFKVSMLSRELGAITAESWPALEYDDFLPIAKGVDSTAAKAERATAARSSKKSNGKKSNGKKSNGKKSNGKKSKK
jgi:uncharacterized protein with GYD domain